MRPLSAVIITYNEARNIGRCLDSLAGIADEVLVVDSFSTDETEAICREKGVRFIQHAFAGHIEQKNYALAQATHDWALSLDADEALDETLRAAIAAIPDQAPADGYAMNRLSNYCGRWIWHAGWYPDRKLRLFDRRKGAWGGVNPHDKVLMRENAKIVRLNGHLLHYSYYTEAEHWQKARRYAEIAAHAMLRQGKRGSLLQVVFSPLAKFIRNYILKAGFLDGRAGWTICKISAVETYWKYSLLRRLRSAQSGFLNK